MGDDEVSGKQMVVKDGRFGPYVTDGETNASLRKGDTVEELTEERAMELLQIRRDRGPVKKKKKAPAKKKKAAAKKKAPAKKKKAAAKKKCRPRRRLESATASTSPSDTTPTPTLTARTLLGRRLETTGSPRVASSI